ncbi:hypothetical protein GGI25_000050 [Coemansia spiralis]|uniref:Dihydropteridine reductase n=2 Tax=Coemansia TaxID=4863 RepID=A0A9W8G827_9FUNG|nr:hypothetical protein EDC05_002695 [Coemansia umbellata]KAJ2623072.1 hypothetical protein GGI26_002681 [Coemansia sp. RSA 1358]KAJ2681095.1 hypothetical protein GGI25_000050 [Coemansia spiralis]
MSSVIVYGGSGALGAVVVSLFKKNAWKVINIDLVSSPEADDNIAVHLEPLQGLSEQGSRITKDVATLLAGAKADAVVCVAGGWQGGNAVSEDFLKSADISIKQSIFTSLIAANIAARHLRSNGLLALTGAVPALGGTPGMIGYGMAKAAVHHLVSSLSMPDSGIDGGRVVGILPVTLDTPANRAAMPNANYSSWTPLNAIAEKLYQWSSGKEPCKSGHLYKVTTEDFATRFE